MMQGTLVTNKLITTMECSVLMFLTVVMSSLLCAGGIVKAIRLFVENYGEWCFENKRKHWTSTYSNPFSSIKSVF